MDEIQISHEFVEFIPDALKERTLYVSMQYATTAHLCSCGCKQKVVAPLSPTDWRLRYDGESISLDPSIGSWNLPCQSHYWIYEGRVIFAPKWTKKRIALAREYARAGREQFFEKRGGRENDGGD